jgi:hypothetical protein
MGSSTPRIIMLLMTVVASLAGAEPVVRLERLPTGGFAMASAAGSVGHAQDVPAAQAGAEHPTIAPRADGGILLAWIEGSCWNTGGSIAWRSFGRTGAPAGQPGRDQNLPARGLAAAASRRDGSVLVIS